MELQQEKEELAHKIKNYEADIQQLLADKEVTTKELYTTVTMWAFFIQLFRIILYFAGHRSTSER